MSQQKKSIVSMGSPERFKLEYIKGAIKDFDALDKRFREITKTALDRLCDSAPNRDVARIKNTPNTVMYRLKPHRRIRVFFGKSVKLRVIRVLAIEVRRENSDTYDVKTLRRLAANLTPEFNE